ncbi:hypothetical protein BGZ47_003213 [Haplosporangium gracile]|nr:hypothetical protein BGZ47_003213 [Haplosporangium gracile]
MSASAEYATNTSPTSSCFKGSNLPPLVTDRPPRVLIAGGGRGGLFLGILLERAGIPYEIFERVAEIKPFGAIMFLPANILPAFEQLGLYKELLALYKELLALSKPLRGGGSMLTDKLKLIANFAPVSPEVLGYERQLFPRPELHDMLFSKIPKEKMHLSKKVLSFQHNHEGAMVRFSDNTSIHGDILVGADGTHSTVRQHLYKTLEKEGLLSKSDR